MLIGVGEIVDQPFRGSIRDVDAAQANDQFPQRVRTEPLAPHYRKQSYSEVIPGLKSDPSYSSSFSVGKFSEKNVTQHLLEHTDALV